MSRRVSLLRVTTIASTITKKERGRRKRKEKKKEEKDRRIDGQGKFSMALPPDLRFSCLVFDIAFHPSQDVIAAGLVSGTIQLYVREAF